MVSAFTHTIVALALRVPFPDKTLPDNTLPRVALPRGAALAGIVVSILPDADVVGFRFGVSYGDFLGHRGFSHSLVFAALLAALVTATWRRVAEVRFSPTALFAYLFLCTASHGLFDAMTNGGLGIAFFSPLDTTRYFLPWQPVEVSPIGIANFFNARGLAVIRSEILWVWMPVIALCVLGFVIRKRALRVPPKT